MNLNVLKNNQLITQINLGELVKDLGGLEASFLIGRSDYCNIVLDDKAISREHAKITSHSGEWTIEKLSEFSEIVHNGKTITKCKLVDGDVLLIGAYTLKIEINLPVNEQKKNEQTVNDSEIKARMPTPMSELAPEGEATEASIADESFAVESEEQGPGEEVALAAEPSSAESVNGADDGFNLPNENAVATEETFEAPPEGIAPTSVDALAPEEGGDENLPVDSESTQVFKGFAKFELELFGENAPYDKYLIVDKDTYIGRDSNRCKIVLNDPEVSSVHAVIHKTNVILVLEDLQSGNGTLLNGSRINKAELSNGDEFLIGSTTFTVRIGSNIIESEKDRFMPVEDNQEVEVEEIVEVGGEEGAELGLGTDEVVEKSFIKRILKDPKKKRIAIVAVLLLLGLLMIEEEPPKEEKKSSKKGETLVDKDKAKSDESMKGLNLTQEQRDELEAIYQLGFELFQTGKYPEALIELEKVKSVSPDYKETRTLIDQSNEGLKKLEELEQKRKADIERKERQEKVKELVEKAKLAVKDRQAAVADALFGKILELDPENFDVPQLKIEIDAWKKEQERLAVEKAQKEADRKRKEGLLMPSKTFYLKKEWHNAIIKFEEFLKIKDMDEDLITDATKMYEESKNNLNELVAPLVGKAKSLKEGQDLKGSYEHYLKVLEFDPTHIEALNEMNEIRELLNARSRKVYREAIISESISMFDDAKEKFLEVQQISPSDSDYYRKAGEKLKNYME